MHRRQPLPRLWMMTDERQGSALLPAAERLPEGAGIVFRHYSLPEDQRRSLFERIRTLATARGFALMLAAPPEKAGAWGADGSHGWQGDRRPDLLRSVSVHDAGEMAAANRLGADFVFVSPVFATRSHPGAAVLGAEGLKALVSLATMPVIALGGMNAERAKLLEETEIYGWAAIDAWQSG